MRVNEHTAVSTAGVLLVPYERRHVPTYHEWMENEANRTATASDRLTLPEEYENQVSWRVDADKLTFIVCRPLSANADEAEPGVLAGVDDAPSRMVGDVNFFLSPWEEDDDENDDENENENDNENGDDSDQTPSDRTRGSAAPMYRGEIDVMIAHTRHRGQGLGRAAVTAFMHYILERQRTAILAEAVTGMGTGTGSGSGSGSGTGTGSGSDTDGSVMPVLQQLMVKIQATNVASISLFHSLGFRQRGNVNYFGEVEMVRTDLSVPAPAGYTERAYVRDTMLVDGISDTDTDTDTDTD